jgi:hypothetical protein
MNIQVTGNCLQQVCALCGIRPATTAEHVPAKSLFAKPRPIDLITVPACGPCNNGTQKNDDYFQRTLALIKEPEPSLALERIRPAVTRAFEKPAAQGLRAHFEHRIGFAPLDNGVVHQPVIKPETRRLNDVVAKHAVGVYYEVMREVLPPSYGTVVLPVRHFHKIPSEGRRHWQKIARAALAGARRKVGDGTVFRFAFNVAHDNRFGFAAVLEYFNNFAYVVHSYARPIEMPGN